MIKILTNSLNDKQIAIFTGDTTNEHILAWVTAKLFKGDVEPFGLNEAHSCCAEFGVVDNNTIVIHGDEDYAIFDIVEEEPIDLNKLINQ